MTDLAWIVQAALLECDWDGAQISPGAAIRLAERLHQLADYMHAEALQQQEALESERQAHTEWPKQQHAKPTLGANRP